MVSFLVWLGPRGPCGPMGGGALPAHGLAGRVEVSGLDAGPAGGGPNFVACGRAGAGRFWPSLAGVAGIFSSGSGPGVGGGLDVVGGALRPLPGRGVFRSKKSHSGRQYLCCDWLCGHGRPFFWTFSTVEERVVASQDRTLVEEDRGFLDPFYVYYEYHGPLVRGARSVDVGVPYGECLQEDE